MKALLCVDEAKAICQDRSSVKLLSLSTPMGKKLESFLVHTITKCILRSCGLTGEHDRSLFPMMTIRVLYALHILENNRRAPIGKSFHHVQPLDLPLTAYVKSNPPRPNTGTLEDLMTATSNIVYAIETLRRSGCAISDILKRVRN